jgi:hypothetical protein
MASLNHMYGFVCLLAAAMASVAHATADSLYTTVNMQWPSPSQCTFPLFGQRSVPRHAALPYTRMSNAGSRADGGVILGTICQDDAYTANGVTYMPWGYIRYGNKEIKPYVHPDPDLHFANLPANSEMQQLYRVECGTLKTVELMLAAMPIVHFPLYACHMPNKQVARGRPTESLHLSLQATTPSTSNSLVCILTVLVACASRASTLHACITSCCLAPTHTTCLPFTAVIGTNQHQSKQSDRC